MNFNRPLILASKSPRRQQLLKEAGFDFVIRSKEIDESFPEDMPAIEVASFLAQKKAEVFITELTNQVLLTADTVVIIENTILGKPNTFNEARDMLRLLSDKEHEVVTGVCIADKYKQELFDDSTTVTFKNLTPNEIGYYINHYKPYDKAGAYGIQEWLGMIGITKMSGSYYNVMGLPVQKIYEVLNSSFLN